MIEIEETETGVYTIRLTGDVLRRVAISIKESGMTRERLIGACLNWGIGFLLYLIED